MASLEELEALAKQGDVNAMGELCSQYYAMILKSEERKKRQEYAKLLAHWSQKAAEVGNPIGKLCLGLLYIDPSSLAMPHDPQKARQLWKEVMDDKNADQTLREEARKLFYNDEKSMGLNILSLLSPPLGLFLCLIYLGKGQSIKAKSMVKWALIPWAIVLVVYIIITLM